MQKNEIKAAVRHAGGSTLTKVGRSANLSATAEDLRRGLNIQIKSFAALRTQHLKSLVSYWQEQGKSTRTIQNKLAHVRAALRAVGRDKFADAAQNSNASLGASGASRGGTHIVPDQKVLDERFRQLPEPFRVAANLQRALGLRAQESIQANKSLRSWEKQIKSGRPVMVLHGTKGGRQRSVNLLDQASRDRALEAVREAIKVMDLSGDLVIQSASLQGANRAFQRAMNSVGFKGNEASHALRYLFAQEQFAKYMDSLGDKEEALAALSMDLGHGDGRGRYCAQVYLGGMGA
jgi:site-specific recombinase XerD